MHATLSDEAKREVYDRTGVVEDEDGLSAAGADWLAYWRGLFPQVTTTAIDEFAAKYRGSDEEREDILSAYKSTGGLLGKVLDLVMLAETPEHELRIAKIIVAAADAGEVSAPSKAFLAKVRRLEKKVASAGAASGAAASSKGGKAGKRKSSGAAGANGAKKAKKRRKAEGASEGDMLELARQIQLNREAGRKKMDAFADALAAKYAGKGKSRRGKAKGKGKSKSKVAMKEPSEAEFLAARARLMKKKK